VWFAFVLMLTIFHHPKTKTFYITSFLARKKRNLPPRKHLFDPLLESSPNKNFYLGMMKNCQYGHTGRPHTQEKSQGAAISVEDAITNSLQTSETGTSCVCI
jgi:hypothetical protein